MHFSPHIFLAYLLIGTLVPQVFHPLILLGFLAVISLHNYQYLPRLAPYALTALVILLFLLQLFPSPFPLFKNYVPFSVAVLLTLLSMYFVCALGIKLPLFLRGSKD